MRQYQFAIGRLAFRTKQNFSYWSELPWALCMLMRPFLEEFPSLHHATWLGLAVASALALVGPN